jgi:hypothetical protein
MTDSRDRQLEQRSSAGALGALLRSEGRTDPTDPEVPDAKRRRAQRRRRSMVFATVAVAGLAIVALALLFHIGRQVTDAEPETTRGDRTLPASSGESQPPGAASRPLASSIPALEAPIQGSSLAASSPPHRAKPPAAPDIIHNPSF